MKRYILIPFLIMYLFSSCNSEYNKIVIDKRKAIPYSTEEFHAWEKSKKISLEEAFKIHYDFALVNLNMKGSNAFRGYGMSYIYDDHYVFSTVTNIRKLGEFNLSGIWVNAETGKAKLVTMSSESNFNTDGFFWTAYYGAE